MAPQIQLDSWSLLSAAVRLPGFLLHNAIAEWPFYLMLLVALGIGVGVDLRRRNLRRYLSGGIRTDLIYAGVELSHLLGLAVLLPWTRALNLMLGNAAPWLRTDLPLPFWLQMVLLFILWDLWAYWYHRALHSSRYLWQFHKVHHSQEQLNAFSNFRVSLLDRMVNMTALAVPTFMLGGNYALPFYVMLLVQFQQLVIHIDVDWKGGWFGRIFVMPAFHVVHHSTAPQHANRNFGSALAVWDRLFGTGAKRGPGPLAFGLTDERVPESYVRQLLVPATGIWTELRKDLEFLRPAAGSVR